MRKVIEHYDGQTEEERAAEIEAAMEAENMTMVAVPTELVPEVVRLITQMRKAKPARARSH